MKPHDRVSHLDWIVELCCKPLGRGAGCQDEGDDSAQQGPNIPSALPARARGENVSGGCGGSIIHSRSPRDSELYISQKMKRKSVSSVVGPLRGSGSERVVELPHPTFVAFTVNQTHRSHPTCHRIKGLLIRQ